MTIIHKMAAIALTVSVLSVSSAAYAEPKPWVWSWWESHWDNQDFEPYLEAGKHPHNTQWDNNKWEPVHWAQQRNTRSDVIKGFYTADILRDQYMDDDIPVLEVGPAFYMLGGHDKRRVTAMVDYTYNITNTVENGMYMIRDWKSGKMIGSYTKYGLQIQ